jgi:hypothetical protein
MSGSGDELRAELEATATIWWVAAVSSAMQRSSGCGHDLGASMRKVAGNLHSHRVGPTFGNSICVWDLLELALVAYKSD